MILMEIRELISKMAFVFCLAGLAPWRPKKNKIINASIILIFNFDVFDKNEMEILRESLVIYTYYKTRSSAASVCLHAINSKTTARIFMRFSPIDRVIFPGNSGI